MHKYTHFFPKIIAIALIDQFVSFKCSYWIKFLTGFFCIVWNSNCIKEEICSTLSVSSWNGYSFPLFESWWHRYHACDTMFSQSLLSAAVIIGHQSRDGIIFECSCLFFHRGVSVSRCADRLLSVTVFWHSADASNHSRAERSSASCVTSDKYYSS